MKIRTLKFHRARNYDYWLISEYSEKFPRNKTEAKKKKKSRDKRRKTDFYFQPLCHIYGIFNN